MSAVRRVVGEPASVLGEQFAKGLFGTRVFGENALVRNFGDVRRLKMNLQWKAIHETSELHSPVIQATRDFVQLLLRRHDDPHLAAADATEVLNYCLQIKHLLNVTSNELADLVHNKEQRLSGAAALHELHAAFSQISRRYISAPHRRLAPAVGGRVSRRIHFMHDPTGLLHRDGDEPFADVPVLVEGLSVPCLESVETARFLERDLEFGEVEITRIVEALQEEPVHDLGDALVASADASVGRDVEDDRLGGYLLGDVAEQNLDLGIAGTLGEDPRRTFTDDRAVLEGETEVLRKARLTGTEEARYPDSDAFVGLLGRFPVALQDLCQVTTDGVGDHILGELVMDDLLVGLVNLDHLLDVAGDVVGE